MNVNSWENKMFTENENQICECDKCEACHITHIDIDIYYSTCPFCLEEVCPDCLHSLILKVNCDTCEGTGWKL